MNDKKLKELEEFIAKHYEKYEHPISGTHHTLTAQRVVFEKWDELTVQVVPDLITAYRQLEKDNEVLKRFNTDLRNEVFKTGEYTCRVLDQQAKIYELEEAKAKLEKDNKILKDTKDMDRHDAKEIMQAKAELLAVLTTDEVDHSTLVETLNSARKIILRLEPEYCYELTEELCGWAEKLTKHRGE